MGVMRNSSLSAIDDALTERVIGAAIAVHKYLGPGLLEGLYQKALAVELGRLGIPHRTESMCSVRYHDVPLGEQRLDLVVDSRVVVEMKALDGLAQVHRAQLLTYLKASGLPIGLLINFGTEHIQVRRVLYTHQSSSSSIRSFAPPS